MNNYRKRSVIANRVLILSCLSVGVFGCAIQSGPDVIDPWKRFTLRGYSLKPDNESGWTLVARSAYQLALAKKGQETDETFAIQTTLKKIPVLKTRRDLLNLVQTGQLAATKPSRFSLKQQNIVIEDGKDADCVRSHLLSVDNAAIKPDDSEDEMMLEVASLICIHPRNRGIAISVNYSHRYYQTQQTQGFDAKADVVFDSVRFEKL